MNSDDVSEASVSQDDLKSVKMEDESSETDLVVEMSSDGEMNSELQIADEILSGMELDLACASEKLVNISVLMMRATIKENEFEATASMRGEMLSDSLEVLELDLLYSILDCEVTEVDKFIKSAQEHVSETYQMISLCKHLGNTTIGLEERLHDFKESLKQSKDQVSEIREQCVRFQRTLSCLNSGENWNNNEVKDFSVDNSDSETKMMMQTAEHQRHILRMLEKSLAREMDVEKKLGESRQVEEDLKQRVLFLEQELFYAEEEVMDVSERCFTAENAAEIFMGTSKELRSKLQIIQFNLTGSVQQEAELRLKLDKSMEQLGSKESALQNRIISRNFSDVLLEQTDSLKANLAEAEENLLLSNNETLALRENISSLEKQLLDSKVSGDGSHNERMILGLTEEVAEGKASNVESKNKKLAGTHMELNEKVVSLEKQLAKSDTKLQHAMASADASQEKENMLYTTIRDMEIVIQNMKSKALKAENRADSVEDKCISLSESNAELNEELNFLRARLESMEQAEKAKISSAKDIDFRSKVIKDLVMQVAIEREHLHKQMVKLALENKTLALKLRQKQKDPAGVNHGAHLYPQDVTKKSAAAFKADKTQKDASSCETDAASVGEIERRIDAGVVSFKHILMAMIILFISATACLFQPVQHRHDA